MGEEENVTVLGLGIMGKGLVRCLSEKGYKVHGWNRSEAKRKEVEELKLNNVTVYSDLAEAILASDEVVIMNVLGDSDLKTASDLVQSIPDETWKGKTVVQYTSHEPLSIKEHEKLIKSRGANLVGGAMMATGESVGTNDSLFFHSVNKDDADAVAALEHAETILKSFGPAVFYKEDVGLASLADIGLIETLWFGMAGHEIAILLQKLYGASKEFVNEYVELAMKIVPSILAQEMGAVKNAVMNDDYEAQGRDEFNVGAMMAVLDMHLAFMTKMGLTEDNIIATHRKYAAMIHPKSLGSSKIVDFLVLKN